MNNKMKKLILKVSSIALAAMLCITSINSNVIFPVSAEGEDVTTDQTTAEETPTETPEETPEPGDEGEPAPVEPQPEETPVENTLEETPAVMSVAKLEAARDVNKSVNFQVKDTDGTVITTDKVDLGLGWVRDSSNLPTDLDANGQHYSFKEVKYNNQTVVYIAEYEEHIYYSSNGTTAQTLPDGAKFDVVYWEYFQVSFDRTTDATDLNVTDMSTIQTATQELKYPKDTAKTKMPELVTTPTAVSGNESVRIYKGEEYNWDLILNADAATGSYYVVTEISRNGERLDAKSYRNGGSFTENITTDTAYSIKLNHNETVFVHFDTDAADSEGIDIVNDGYYLNTPQIVFSVTTKKQSLTDGDTFQSVFLRIRNSEGVFEEYSIDVPANDGTCSTTAGKYTVEIKRNSSGWPFKTYTYTFTISADAINEDLYFTANGKSNAWSRLEINSDTHVHAGIATDSSTISSMVSGRVITLNTVHPSEKIYLYSDAGYSINLPELKEKDSVLGSISFSDASDPLQPIPENASGADAVALNKGYTHYVEVEKSGIYAYYSLNITASPMPFIYRVISNETELNNETGVFGEREYKYTLPTESDTEKQIFLGWAINGDTTNLHQSGEEFVVDESTWSLGIDQDVNGVTTRIFEFTAVFRDKDTIYTVEHYLQGDDGQWPDTPYQSVQTSSSEIADDVVIGMPIEFDGYHLDEDETNQVGYRSLHIVNGKPVDENGNAIENAVIKLYYAKNMQYATLSVHNHIEGKYADMSKKFTYKITATPGNASFPKTELIEFGFAFNSESNAYEKEVELGNGESLELPNLPVTDCVYKVEVTNPDSFYDTTKQVLIADEEQPDDENNTSHSFTTMTPNSTHAVHFTHTSREVIPAGNLFDNTGFDLMLSMTASVGLLCAIYVVLKKKIQAGC